MCLYLFWHYSTVQPKNNTRARTSFCIRKTATSCGYLQDACARILKATKTSLQFEAWKGKNCFAIRHLDHKNFFAVRYLDCKNFFAVATLKRRNTPLLIGRDSRNKIVLMFSFFNTKGRAAILNLAIEEFQRIHARSQGHICVLPREIVTMSCSRTAGGC